MLCTGRYLSCPNYIFPRFIELIIIVKVDEIQTLPQLHLELCSGKADRNQSLSASLLYV